MCRRFGSIKTRGPVRHTAHRAELAHLYILVLRTHEQYCAEHCLVIATTSARLRAACRRGTYYIVLRGLSTSNLPRIKMLLKLADYGEHKGNGVCTVAVTNLKGGQPTMPGWSSSWPVSCDCLAHSGYGSRLWRLVHSCRSRSQGAHSGQVEVTCRTLRTKARIHARAARHRSSGSCSADTEYAVIIANTIGRVRR